MPPPKLLPSMMSAPKNPGAFRPDPNAKDRPDLLSVPVDFIKGLLGIDANTTGRTQDGKPSLLSSPNAVGQMLTSGLPIAGGSKLLYSRLEKAAQALPEMAHPNRILGLLKSNASGEEMQLRGIMDFLKSRGERKVSRADVLNHLEQNPLPNVKKTTLIEGGRKHPRTGEQIDRALYGTYPGLTSQLEAPRKNYNENLYHLVDNPGEQYTAPHFEHTNINAGYRGQSTRQANENLLMHSRTSERDLPEQGLTLHGEEDQSDWHQQGRKEGYRDSSIDEPRRKVITDMDAISDEIEQLGHEYYGQTKDHIVLAFARGEDHPLVNKYAELRNKFNSLREQLAGMPRQSPFAVPQAPYKQEWSNILWKDQLGQAVEDPAIKGYSWAQGSEQNRRSGRTADDWAAPGSDPEKAMKDFYDVRKKNAIDKFLRQHGGSVEEITVPGVPKKQPLKDYAVTPRGEIQELPSPDEWGEMGDEGDIVASVWPQFRSMNEDLPRGFQVIDALERQQEAKGLTIPTEVKIWYAALPDHVKESIKRGGIPFLMALWATHQAGQDNNMAIPTPPGGIQ